MKQQGFAPILIVFGVLVILGLLGVSYYLGTIKSKPQQLQPVVTSQNTPQPTIVAQAVPDETANWKTYTDNKIGIKFKYPNNWYAKLSPAWTFNINY
ncbi:hypothetical protein M1437_01145, partial [Patescibacteria group bacterium]|nr:hypothetical protein [Patescibacteria group bacterium]